MIDVLEGQMGLFESPAGHDNNINNTPEQAKAVKKESKRAPRPSPAPVTKPAPSRQNKRSTAKPSQKRSLSGLVPQGDVRLTANIREDLHLKLKIAAAHQRTTIGELIEKLVEKHLK